MSLMAGESSRRILEELSTMRQPRKFTKMLQNAFEHATVAIVSAP